MRFWAVLLLAVLPVQALALSCLRPTVAGSFTQAQAADETYVVVAGRLSFKPFPKPTPRANRAMPPKLTKVPATLTGKALSRNGFKTPFDRKITLEVGCLASWCGGAQNGEEVLAFVRLEAGKYALAVGPCGGWAFANPTPAMLRQAKRCMRGGTCPAR